MDYERQVTYYRKRQIIDLSAGIPDNWGDCILLCLNRATWDIARAFISHQGQWDSTFASYYGDGYYLTLSEEDFDTVQGLLSAGLGACIMSCNEIVEALNNVALQISTSGCGQSGSGGAGQTSQAPNTFEDNGTNFPPGYTSRSDFEGKKCKRANIIVSGWQHDIGFIKDLDLLTLSIPIIVGALLTPIPFDDVAALVGLLAAWALEGLADGYLTEIQDFFNDNEEELVCRLYSHPSAEQTEQNLTNYFASELSFPSAVFAQFWLDFTNINSLFEPNSLLNNLPDTINYDCGLCAPLSTNLIIYRSRGTIDEGPVAPADTYRMTYTDEGGFHRIAFGRSDNGEFEFVTFAINGYVPQAPGQSARAISIKFAPGQDYSDIPDYIESAGYVVLKEYATAADIIFALEGRRCLDVDLAGQNGTGFDIDFRILDI